MKRYLTFIVLLVCIVSNAQNINDVLRYSNENLQGTARFQAMGGAFGALGGDLSALNINPAGSAIFSNSLFTMSGTHYNMDNSSNYFNTTAGATSTDVDFNQIGGVFVFKSSDNSPWRKLALALNYDVVQNFEDEYRVRGNSDQGIDNYFLNFADGLSFNSFQLQDGEYIEDAYLDIGANDGYRTQQAFLGYYGGLIDPDGDDTTTSYISNATYSNVNQDYFKSTSGYNSKFTANFSGQYQDNLYLGASLNFHTVLYEEIDDLRETGYDTASVIQNSEFANFLHTEGTGFSYSLGAIAKLNQNVRLGGSYQSPTWYKLTDDFAQRINSNIADSDISYINFNVINLFEEYKIKTPAKFTGSLAYVFGRDGLLSFDYGYQDYSKAELRPSNVPSFNGINNIIASELSAVSTFKIGGEYRIDQVSLRGGYRFEQSPYSDGNTIGDLNGYSGGIGYNFGGNKLDLAINRTEREFNMLLFDTGVTTPALINKINTTVSLSYTMNF